MTTIDLLQVTLMYGVVPLWAAAGTADYACHRASRIEDTSGPKESVLHLLEMIEAGGPLLAVLFLEINAGILLFMVLGLVMHQATAVWDVRYANQTREVSPTEQHVHGIMETLPLMAVVVVAVIHWPALLSLFGHGVPSYAIELKKPPLPGWYLVSVLAAAAGVGFLYIEELARTVHARRRRVGVMIELAQESETAMRKVVVARDRLQAASPDSPAYQATKSDRSYSASGTP